MNNTDQQVRAAIDEIVRHDWGRLLAALIASLRDFQLAEDCLQEAFSSALEHWPRGLPRNPNGWLLQTARRKAIDRIRRSANFDLKSSEVAYLAELDQRDSEDPQEDIPDERLRLIFTACHPALDQKTRLAMTLRTLCGLTTSEIARAFLDSETAMAGRLVRAKKKIAKAGIPYSVPEGSEWQERLGSVLAVLYLIFNEGYSALKGEAQVRLDLCDEAIYLARTLHTLRPEEPEILGLLALMLLNHARRNARSDAAGALVPLEAQDRKVWDSEMIAEGLALVETALRRGRPGPYQLQAAISAVHSEAKSHSETRWDEIVMIYDRLIEISPNPVIQLNRLMASSYCFDAVGLIEPIRALRVELEGYQPFHAALADLHRRAGDAMEAIREYELALKLTENEAERTFLRTRLDQAKKEAEQSSAQVQQGG